MEGKSFFFRGSPVIYEKPNERWDILQINGFFSWLKIGWFNLGLTSLAAARFRRVFQPYSPNAAWSSQGCPKKKHIREGIFQGTPGVF